MALTTAQAALLASYQVAYGKLIRGELVAKVNANGREVAYSAADKDALKAEIDGLLAIEASSSGRRRGAIGVRL